MPAADARLTNTNYPTPETLGDFSVTELLTAAAYGRIGLDKRLIKTILERGDAAIPELTHFAMEPFPDEHDTANLTRSLFLLLRHYKTPQAVPFFIELLYANIEELPEELMEAVLEVGEPAVEPVLEMFDKIDDEEQRGEIAFLLASFRNRDPRILERLVDHFEYDAGDGIIILDSFGDPGAIPAIEKVIAEPGLDPELHKELVEAVERLREDAPLDDEKGPAYDVLAEFPDAAKPVFDLLTDYELMRMLESPSEEYRTGAIENLVPQELTTKVAERIHLLARTDPSGALRGRAWEALARDPDDKALVAELIAVLEDTSKPPEERSGALIALASLDKYSKVKEAILDFYHSFPQERARVIKAMWRSLDRGWAKYVVEALSHDDEVVREQAILGIGNLSLGSEADKLEALFDHETLRPAALYAYALAAPGETTRARMKSLFNRIEKLADDLDDEEAELVESALDERLASRGLKPVFHVEQTHEHHHHHHGDDHDLAHHDHGPKAVEGPPKVGRNDPCPCGSGKKYKKCHGQ